MNLWGHQFYQNMNKKLSGFQPYSSSEAHYRAEIPTIFCSYFGRNDDSINLFWNLLTFSLLFFSFSFQDKILLLQLWGHWNSLQYLLEEKPLWNLILLVGAFWFSCRYLFSFSQDLSLIFANIENFCLHNS